MHGKCKLIRIKHAVSVHVCQSPDLGQNRIGKSGLDHLFLGNRAGDFALCGIQLVEDKIPPVVTKYKICFEQVSVL